MKDRQIGTILGIVLCAGISYCAIRSGTAKCQSVCEFADKNGGRIDTVIIGYYQDKDGSGKTESQYRVVLPDGSIISEAELYRRGLLRFW